MNLKRIIAIIIYIGNLYQFNLLVSSEPSFRKSAIIMGKAISLSKKKNLDFSLSKKQYPEKKISIISSNIDNSEEKLVLKDSWEEKTRTSLSQICCIVIIIVLQIPTIE